MIRQHLRKGSSQNRRHPVFTVGTRLVPSRSEEVLGVESVSEPRVCYRLWGRRRLRRTVSASSSSAPGSVDAGTGSVTESPSKKPSTRNVPRPLKGLRGTLLPKSGTLSEV